MSSGPVHDTRLGRGAAGVMTAAKRWMVGNIHEWIQWPPGLKKRQIPLNLPLGNLAVVLSPLGFFHLRKLVIDDA